MLIYNLASHPLKKRRSRAPKAILLKDTVYDKNAPTHFCKLFVHSVDPFPCNESEIYSFYVFTSTQRPEGQNERHGGLTYVRCGCNYSLLQPVCECENK